MRDPQTIIADQISKISILKMERLILLRCIDALTDQIKKLTAMIKIDWKQRSTIRGAVWLVTAVIGFGMALTGQAVDQVLLVGAAVAGGLGVGVKD